MPLTDADWDLLTCLVRDHVVDPVDPRPALRLFLPPQVVAALALTSTSSENALQVVAAVRDAGLQGPAPLAIALLRHLEQHPRVSQLEDVIKIRDYLRRLVAEKEAVDRDDPFATRVLGGGPEVFLDRSTLRPTVRTMVADPGKFVLRILGEPDTGKSYTFAFLQHLASTQPVRPARVVVTPASTADDVLSDLALYISDGELPPRLEDPAKWIRHAARFLVRRAGAAPLPWWLVLDQCNDLVRGSDVLELIAELVLAAYEERPGRSRPRLILLGYGDELPPLPHDARGRVHLDEVHPVKEAELHAFFTSEFSRLSAGPELVDAVEAAVRHVLESAAQATATGGCYMTELGKAAEEARLDYVS